MRVLVVGPDRKDLGGVANYYNSVFPRLSDDTITAHYLEIGSTHGQNTFVHLISDQVRFWRTLSLYRPDVVHLNPSLVLRSFLRDGLFIFVAKIRRRQVLVFFRGWRESFEKKVSGPFNRFFAFTYCRADEFIVLATRHAKCLRDWGISAPIHFGTTAVADELLEGFSIYGKIDEIKNDGAVRLLFLSRLEQKKGVLELIDAVEKLLKQGVKLSLTIAGDGPIMSQVRQRVAKFDPCQNNVRIVGYVRGKEKTDILRSHDIFCFPTQFTEGMPNSVLEAMAFGMAIITPSVGGIADFFEDNKMGKLLIKSNSQYISDAIETLASNHSQLAEIARYNSEYAQDHFLASTAAGMLRTRYQKMINDGMEFT